MLPDAAQLRSGVAGSPKFAFATDVWSLTAITVLSSVPYIARLGFYSDDWGLIESLHEAERAGSFAALLIDDFVARPVQGLYLGLLYKAFHFDPLGYHLVNTAVIAASVALLYLLLVRIGCGRACAFAAALIFAMLPQLSTVRVWYSAFQVPLAMVLMLVSLHLQLSYARSRKTGLLVGAVGAAILCIGCYEIFAPIIAGFAAALAYQARRLPGRTGAGHSHITLAAVALLVVVLLGAAYKAAFSGRSGNMADFDRYLAGLRQLVRLDYDWRVDSGVNIVAALRCFFWWPVRDSARGAAALLGGTSSIAIAAIAAIVGALAFWRLNAAASGDIPVPLKRLLLIGAATFVLGLATFLLVPSIHFSPTGIDNRVDVAAAIGAAMILVGLVLLLVRAVPRRLRRPAFALITAVAACGLFARIAAVEEYWAETPPIQNRVLATAKADLRNVPAGSTVILDGVCPYHGPAIVFETYWDTSGALSFVLGRPVVADAVSPRMSVQPAGLATSIYKQPSLYPYGPKLFMYDPLRHIVVRLPDRQAARHYFEARRPVDCPSGFVGRGVEV